MRNGGMQQTIDSVFSQTVNLQNSRKAAPNFMCENHKHSFLLIGDY
jgi:hypothetical protein